MTLLFSLFSFVIYICLSASVVTSPGSPTVVRTGKPSVNPASVKYVNS